jgi:arsenite methyltransferase
MAVPTQDSETPESVHRFVRKHYSEVAARKISCCGASTPVDTHSQNLGYTDDALDSVPEDANLGLGCGNPIALASLQPGEVVVDLGAGAGLDALVAAKAVGPHGRVIGVDMTTQMLASARKNAVEMGVHAFVEFREGLIENIPVASETADLVISNCVINLSPDKPAVFQETFRILKPGGRLAVSDIVLSAPLPKDLAELAVSYVACLSGASTEDEYFKMIREAGFSDVKYTRKPVRSLFLDGCADPLLTKVVQMVGEERLKQIADTVWSYEVTASKS